MMKFCIHLGYLNLLHSEVVVVTGLKLKRRGYFQWLYLPTEFHKNLPFGSKVESGRQTQTEI
jgi:hypothetical protein